MAQKNVLLPFSPCHLIDAHLTESPLLFPVRRWHTLQKKAFLLLYSSPTPLVRNASRPLRFLACSLQDIRCYNVL